MENFYSEVINILKEDAKKITKQIESSTDSKQKNRKVENPKRYYGFNIQI